MNRPAQPPRYVPTLTQVVVKEPLPEPMPAKSPEADINSPAVQVAPPSSSEPDEALVQRVLKQIALTLDEQLQEAVRSVIDEQTTTLMPRLRAEIEAAVRRTIKEALTLEIPLKTPDRQAPE